MPVPSDPRYGWKYLFFSERLSAELEASRSLQCPTEEPVSLFAHEFLDWISKQMASLQSIPQSATRLIRDVLPVALGPESSPGDAGEIEYVVSQLGEAYRAALLWPVRIRAVQTDARWAGVLRETSLLTSNMISEFEQFASQMAAELPELLRREQAGEAVGPGFALTLTMPDTHDLTLELEAASVAFGIG